MEKWPFVHPYLFTFIVLCFCYLFDNIVGNILRTIITRYLTKKDTNGSDESKKI